MERSIVFHAIVGILIAGSLVSGASAAHASEAPAPAVVDDESPQAPPAAGTDAAAAGYPCPSLRGIAGQSSEIKYTYTWINDGCPTPIRKGFYTRTGFGLDHINFRRVVDGLANHETTDYARTLWAQALATPGKAAGAHEMCHQKKYTTPGGTNRTMRVWHSSTNYEGDKGRKGIISAYYLGGHVDACKNAGP